MFDRLSARFGESNIFLDIDSIPAGKDFYNFIDEQVAQADVVLAIIGPSWLEQLRARASRSDDFVRIEIQTALDRRMPVIPVLVGGVSMPDANELPVGLQRLCRMNACTVSSGRDFSAHATRLINAIESVNATRLIRSGSSEARQEIEGNGDILKFSIRKDGAHLSYAEVVELWQIDDSFREFYLYSLALRLMHSSGRRLRSRRKDRTATSSSFCSTHRSHQVSPIARRTRTTST